MSTTPAEEFESARFSLENDIRSLQDSVKLSRIRDEFEDFHSMVNGMARRIAATREGGYAFEKQLENQAAEFVKQWNTLRTSVQQQINNQANFLQSDLRPIETQMSTLAATPSRASSLLPGLKSSIQTLKDKVAASERMINGMYDRFKNEVNGVNTHLNKVEWMLTQLGEASFKLLPTESGIMAVKAVWCEDVKEKDADPDGVLYLTDQRVIFEQKEEIATKKILFIATEKKKVQELEWEAPIALLEDVKTRKQGLMKNEDHIDLSFSPGAPHQTIHLHIWQPCEEWKVLLNKAKAKEFDSTRAIAIDQAEVDKVKSVPAQCPSCGANMDQVILRGQDTVKCEYCGYVIRL